MENYVIATANAGMLLCIKGKKILLDALHNEIVKGYSCVPKYLQKKIISGEDEYSNIDYLIVTHNHPDHVSQVLVNNFARLHSETAIFSPVNFSNCSIMNTLILPSENYSFGNDRFYFRRTMHDGVEYKNTVNYAGIINIDGIKISFLGDSSVDKNIITDEFLDNIDIAIFNFPFISLSRGREIIKLMNPSQIIVCHLPYIEDDINGYVKVTERLFEKKQDQLPPTIILKEAEQKEKIEF